MDSDKALEEFEHILEQERLRLEKKESALRKRYQCASVLLQKGEDDDVHNVSGLLENRDLLLSVEPSLESQFDLLQYFSDCGLLNIDQVTEAVNEIRRNSELLECVKNPAKTLKDLASVQKRIHAFDTMSDTTKANKVLRSKLSDEEKLAVLRSMAYHSCLEATVEKTDLDTITVSADMVSSFKDSYSQVMEEVNPYLTKYYYKVSSLSPEELDYYRQVVEIYDELKKEGREQELSDTMNYDDIRLLLSVYQMRVLKDKIDGALKSSDQGAHRMEELREDLSSLNSTFQVVQELDQQFSEEKDDSKVDDKSHVYFLLDDDGKPFFQLESFSKNDRKKMRSILTKLEGLGKSDRDIKSKPVLVGKKFSHHMYTVNSSNLLVSFIPYQGDVLVLSFADRRDIYDESVRIYQREQSLIEKSLKSMKSSSSDFVLSQQVFQDSFSREISDSLDMGGMRR